MIPTLGFTTSPSWSGLIRKNYLRMVWGRCDLPKNFYKILMGGEFTHIASAGSEFAQ
jgi:hypothetical protein